jgi:segregation and condensation protein B
MTTMTSEKMTSEKMTSEKMTSEKMTSEKITPEKMQSIIEAALMVAGYPLTVSSLQNLFREEERPSHTDIKAILTAIHERYQHSGIALQEVASGYRLQAKAELSPWLSKLWEERAPRYSRAFLETLAIITYKQPITRAEIEEIRGVTVSSHIVKTLLEREWIRVIGYREVPGKPAIYGTTKEFLDHFNLKSLTDLPILAEFKNLKDQEAKLQVQLALENSNIGPDDSEVIPLERAF